MDIRPLKTEADHAKAVAEIETLMDAKPGSRAFDRLEALARLVDAYAAKAHPIEALDPVDAILFHLEQLGDPRMEAADYIDVSSRLEELGCPKPDDHAIGILPVGFDTLTAADRFGRALRGSCSRRTKSRSRSRRGKANRWGGGKPRRSNQLRGSGRHSLASQRESSGSY